MYNRDDSLVKLAHGSGRLWENKYVFWWRNFSKNIILNPTHQPAGLYTIYQNHWHPAFINRGNTPSNNLKILGFQNALRELSCCENPPVFWLDIEKAEWQGSYDATRRLLKDHPDTDSIIYAMDFLANAGIRALKDAGISIPGQVAVIGVDNSTYARISSPGLTSLDNKLEQLSTTCADILVKVLQGEKVANKMMLFSDIVEREST